jgi:hypothetical protein
MGLFEIKTFDELRKFIPLLVKIHRDLDGFWEEGINESDFVALLSEQFFRNNTGFYGIRDGETLHYFIAVVDRGDGFCHCWLLYINKNSRVHSTNLIKTLKSEYKRLGYSKMTFTTTRITRSFDRWVSKFGAQKSSLTYKMEL